MITAPQRGQTAIYFLVDPRKPEAIRYVGRAQAPRTRHLQHCAEAATSPKGEWIESLRQEGILPQMIVVEWVPSTDEVAAEKLWIERVKPDLLTNNAVVQARNGKPSTLATIAGAERDLILEALKRTGWNKQEAARRLGVGRQTLYNKIKLYSLTEKDTQ